MKRAKKRKDTTSKMDKLEDFQALSQSIMQLAMQGLLRMDFLQRVLTILMEHAECDSVEIWVMERGKYFQGEVLKPSTSSFHFSIMNTSKTRNGHLIPEARKGSTIGS